MTGAHVATASDTMETLSTVTMIASARAVLGYVSDSHETVDALGSRSINLQIRVPADKFDGSLLEAEKLGKALDKQVTVILSQSEGERPVCAIYFNLSSPYHKKRSVAAPAKPAA